MITYNSFKNEVHGEIPIRDDEYIGEDGLPYCKECKTARFVFIEDIDNPNMAKIILSPWCECKRNKAEREEYEEKCRKEIDAFNARKEASFLGKRYRNVMFDTAKITENNKQVYESARKYVEHADDVLENNIGLYIYGANGSGKTYLSACICNELVLRFHSCVYTNFASLVDEMRYNSTSSQLVNAVKNCEFAFIDDFGKEFIGREQNASSSKWLESKLFEIINERYNACKPTIFSSNYSIGELVGVLGLDRAIVERINEMSTRVIKLQGDNFRDLIASDSAEIAKKIGI